MAATQSPFTPCTTQSNFSPLNRHLRHRLHGPAGIPFIQKLPSSGKIRCIRDHEQQHHHHHHSSEDANNQPAPLPPKPTVPPWLSWVFWSVLYIGPLFQMKEAGKPPRLIEKIEEVVETVEEAIEAVEDVAELVNDVADVVEKASSDLADDLPKDSMMKRVAEGVEKAADAVGDGAEETIDFINKVQGLEEELESKVDNFVYKKLGDVLRSLITEESKKKNSHGIEGKGGGAATDKRGS